MTDEAEQKPKRKPRRRARLVFAVGATAAEAAIVAKRRGSLLRMDTVVRCRDGHIFTTLWVPGVSIKAVRLGWWRFQRCPVGRHWSLVTPLDVTSLSDEERTAAAQSRDSRVP